MKKHAIKQFISLKVIYSNSYCLNKTKNEEKRKR